MYPTSEIIHIDLQLFDGTLNLCYRGDDYNSLSTMFVVQYNFIKATISAAMHGELSSFDNGC